MGRILSPDGRQGTRRVAGGRLRRRFRPRARIPTTLREQVNERPPRGRIRGLDPRDRGRTRQTSVSRQFHDGGDGHATGSGTAGPSMGSHPIRSDFVLPGPGAVCPAPRPQGTRLRLARRGAGQIHPGPSLLLVRIQFRADCQKVPVLVRRFIGCHQVRPTSHTRNYSRHVGVATPRDPDRPRLRRGRCIRDP